MLNYDDAYKEFLDARDDLEVLEGFITSESEVYNDMMDAGALLSTEECAEMTRDLEDISGGIHEVSDALIGSYERACLEANVGASLPSFVPDDLLTMRGRDALARQMTRALFDGRSFADQYQFVIDECDAGRIVPEDLVGTWIERAVCDAEDHPARTDEDRLALERTYGYVEDMHLIEGASYGTDEQVSRARAASRAYVVDGPSVAEPALDEPTQQQASDDYSLGW